MDGLEEMGRVLAAKFAVILPHLDERQRRLLLGAEARALGHGGIRLVARAAGVREAHGVAGRRRAGCRRRSRWAGSGGRAGAASGPLTWTRGCSRRCWPWSSPTSGETRCPRCGGRPSRPAAWPSSWPARVTRSRPTRWAACCGPRASACRATPRSSRASSTRTGTRQFRYINEQARAHQGTGDPVISVDAKKKELVGEFSNAGRQWRPKGSPAATLVHDFPDDAVGKAVPYGIYDITANAGWVNVGTDHDTAAFAVESVRRWWKAARPGGVPAGRAAADHRRRRRLQRLPHPGVEGRAGRPGRRDRPGDHRLPLPARHFKVEQGRAPAVLPHHDELARTAPDQPRGHREHHRRDHHPHRAEGPRRARRRHLRRPASRSATRR